MSLVSMIFVSGCDIYTVLNCLFPFEYDAVYYFIPECWEVWIKDTTICFSRNDLRLLTLHDWGDGKKYGHITIGGGDVDKQFDMWQCDTVSLFIFDKNVIDNYQWDYIVNNYCILQRYDLSKEDLVRLNYQITYPPTKEMMDIHMFPRH